ncbi:NGG1p interacting factor 3 [Amanita rubescens]|nr:NGG1p interacting factor 3 [Amanita rubescens]
MAPPIVKVVCRAMERIAPLRLAASWDNVGLLLESPIVNPKRKDVILTPEVMEETVSSNAAVLVAYHPPIFKGLQAFTLANALQKSLLNCAAHGISVYSPHSALDSVYGGINDWLAKGVLEREENGSVRPLLDTDIGPEGAEGRLVELVDPITMELLVKRMKAHLNIDYIQIGAPSENRKWSTVQTVAICAGSGGSMLKGQVADVYLTGEMSHHDVLAAVSEGVHVMICGHTNTERGYLPILAAKLRSEFDQTQGEEDVGLGDVLVSRMDRHPLKVV